MKIMIYEATNINWMVIENGRFFLSNKFAENDAIIGHTLIPKVNFDEEIDYIIL